MTFGASIAVLAFAIVVIGAVLFVRRDTPRRRRRQHRAEQPLEPLSDPPTITHYGHG